MYSRTVSPFGTRRRVLEYLKGLLSPVERKNGWQLAEQAGDSTPDGCSGCCPPIAGMPIWCATTCGAYVVEHLGDTDGVLVVDETGFLRRGPSQWGYSANTAALRGGIENCQIGVFLTYASSKGRTLLDREL